MPGRVARWRGVAVGAAVVGLVVVPGGGGAGRAGEPGGPEVLAAAPEADGFPELTPAVAAELDGAVRKVLKEAGVPGVLVSLSAPGKGEYVRAFGVADRATGAPMKTDMNMRIGSVTKTFTVTALLRLVDQGKAGLDDPVGKYVAGVPNGERITLRELAEMRSGLYDYSEDAGFFKALTSDPRRPFTPQELLSYAFRHPVLFAPGQKFSYCNTNLVLLGLVVEKVSGQPLDRFVTDQVIQPAGLRHTLFPTDARFPDPHPQGYTDQTADGKVQDAADWNPSWGWAAGAMTSDLGDLRSWAGTLAAGTLLKPATQARRLKLVQAAPDAGYGLGLFDVAGWIGHNGSLPGYEALAVHLPRAQATLVVLLNTDIPYRGSEPSTAFGEAITKIVTPRHVFALPAQPVTGP
ncbi:serine hydrolase domain-containing protein [Streptomyces racemochromogenes]|uniref:Serine hydrolase domain-containing protein n=1 Tax=Streptomyces racemochromogenes TaxID=67353 RepID=A0ABW7PD84_9ACTN